MANENSVMSLEDRIKAMEAQVRALNVGPAASLGKLAAFSAGSCTNECTAACTIGCTNGCTGSCVAEEPGMVESLATRVTAPAPDIGLQGAALYARLKGQGG